MPVKLLNVFKHTHVHMILPNEGNQRLTVLVHTFLYNFLVIFLYATFLIDKVFGCLVNINVVEFGLQEILFHSNSSLLMYYSAAANTIRQHFILNRVLQTQTNSGLFKFRYIIALQSQYCRYMTTLVNIRCVCPFTMGKFFFAHFTCGFNCRQQFYSSLVFL